MHRTIVEAVIDYALKTPTKLAVCFKKERVTYSQLEEYIKRGAYKLSKEYHIKAGDIVVVSALSKPDFVVTFLAIQYLGATVVPLDKSLSEQNFTKICGFIKPKLIVSDSKMCNMNLKQISLKAFYSDAKNSDNESAEEYSLADMDSIAEIIFTTGTTGESKGAMLSYENVKYITEYTRNGVERREDDVELIPLPLNHSFGLRVLRALLDIGATAVLQNGFMFIKETINNLAEFQCNRMCAVPSSIEKLQRNLGDEFFSYFGKLKYIEISAGSLSIVSKQRLLEVLPNTIIYNVWGSSETGGVIFLNVSKNAEHIGSLGTLPKGVEIKFFDDGGNEVSGKGVTNAGRMALRGKMQMKGYLNREDITEKTIVDGYLQTNDLAYITEDGFVYMLGRTDDIINVGGEKVSPIEIENVAGHYKEIEECACIGGRDKTGEFEIIPVLFVVPNSGNFDEKKCMSFLATELEQFKLPRAIVTVNILPRNSMNKIDRKRLKKMWEQNETNICNSVISAIYNRRSVRNFKEIEVPRALIEQIVSCGYQAPSGHNMQTWKFTVITNKKEITSLKEIILSVAKKNKVYFYGFNNPPVLILVSNDVRNQYSIQDASCAIQNIMLAAYSLGLGSVWINVLMKLCDKPEIRSKLRQYKVPDCHNVWGMVALGYPANQPSQLAKKTDVVEWVE